MKFKKMESNQEIFLECCKDGKILDAQKIFEKTHLDVSFNMEISFRQAARYNRLEILIWLLLIKPDIKINILDWSPIRESACYGHLKVLIFLLSIDDSFKNFRDLFICGIWYSNLNISLYIAENYPEVKTKENINIAMKLARENKDEKCIYYLKNIAI